MPSDDAFFKYNRLVRESIERALQEKKRAPVPVELPVSAEEELNKLLCPHGEWPENCVTCLVEEES